MKKSVVVVFNFTRDRWPAAQRLFIATGHAALAAAPKQEFGYTLRFADEG